jgi:hypothetical protein
MITPVYIKRSSVRFQNCLGRAEPGRMSSSNPTKRAIGSSNVRPDFLVLSQT